MADQKRDPSADQPANRRRLAVIGAVITALLLIVMCRGTDTDGGTSSPLARSGDGGSSAPLARSGAGEFDSTVAVGGRVPDSSAAPVATEAAAPAEPAPATAPATAPAPVPARAGNAGVSGRNPLDVNDTRDLGPNVSSDVRIALQVVGANAADSAIASLAAAGGQSADVRAYAARMVADHGAMNRRVLTIVQRLDATPLTPRANNAIHREGQADLQRLRDAPAAGFDAAYLEVEVASHRHFLGSLNRELIVGARDPELRRLLEEIRVGAVAHGAEATRLRAAHR